MTQSNLQLKRFWTKLGICLCRALLVMLVGLMGYIVSRPSYNYAHWLPHKLLRHMGLSYEELLWIEQHGDYFLHFFGALLLTLILSAAQLPYFRQNRLRPMLFIILLCIGAEALQFRIGRGVESSDLLLGILGSFMAYLAIDKIRIMFVAANKADSI